ncbi:MAG: hypothetical protein F2708_02450 [Actinobacteria bacterium]|uniref:Unannotated protein n=1 Tax=freshwater metagenome TaxID=449393 RepID=A0A6J6U3G6_9ZZZZ|nr:hypothetical protein [Actinomycetota bacterium]
MSILDLGTGPSRPSVGKKSTRIFLGFGLLIAVIGIGSTFASTISINANQDIEFGQGVQKSIFCGGDEKITVTPISSFANNEELGTFGFTGITISDIPAECSDRDFVVKVYDNNGGSQPLELSHTEEASMSLANVWWANGCPEDESGCRLSNSSLEDGYALVSASLEDYNLPVDIADVMADSPTSFTITFLSDVLSSEDVKKIVIETQNDTYGFDKCVELTDCTVNS